MNPIFSGFLPLGIWVLLRYAGKELLGILLGETEGKGYKRAQSYIIVLLSGY